MQAQVSHARVVGTLEVQRVARMSYPYLEYAKLTGVDYGTVLSAADGIIDSWSGSVGFESEVRRHLHRQRWNAALDRFAGELRVDLEDLVVQVEFENAKGLPR